MTKRSGETKVRIIWIQSETEVGGDELDRDDRRMKETEGEKKERNQALDEGPRSLRAKSY